MTADVLRARLGPAVVQADPDVMAAYARDTMPLAAHGMPAAVVFPDNTEAVQTIVRTCAELSVPIVTRGAGTGLTGAANAVDGCVVLVTTKLNRIVEIDPGNRLAVVQPGVINAELRNTVAEYGLFYPPDPSSLDSCTIGGNLATNAGGLCCVKYGVTADAVLGLEVVLADGSLLRTGRRTVKGVAGYDLTKLFVGSEGTLGVITEATLALRPKPPAPSTLVAGFAETVHAGNAVAATIRAGLAPSLLEIMDATSIEAAEAHLKTDLGTEDGCRALLLCQSDSGGDVARAELEAIERICVAAGARMTYVTDDPEDGRTLLHARRVVLTALEAYGACLTDDVAVPRTRIADLISGCARIGDTAGLRIAVVGHAGDGNMHPTIVYDPASAEERGRARQAFDAILRLGLSLGGTLTGEHGVGRIKREWLERELGPVGLRVHRRIKAALDPANLFNPDSMFFARNPVSHDGMLEKRCVRTPPRSSSKSKNAR
ncbi:FAD-binding oxidoreductase [Amycolatopsis jejuensis]|uniref:FAD-binding oxidoreductase n=1 Tax=Amycolatopsis jejuensis TaxID=330084 RepID=UPI000A01FDD0|nr:FAD-linked oxidase C-terminal domain-containing protein [Amycolatopsis jejuensis]